MSIKKNYVVDTNVLVHDPEALCRFEEHNIFLPMEVIEELDGLKRGQGDIPHSVRQALRSIDSFRERGNISEGVIISDLGGILRVVKSRIVDEELDSNSDNRIISVALRLNALEKNVVLVSKDISVRIKAEALGLAAQDYKTDKSSLFEMYGQIHDAETPHLNGIHSLRFISVDGQVCALNGAGDERTPIRFRDAHGVRPRNDEQRCALFALMNPSISVVALTGKAGTGKTLLALAAGIAQSGESNELAYDQVIVYRPIAPLAGNEIGFLPGSVEEKIGPWMEPILDNLDVLVKTPINNKIPKRQPGELPQRIFKNSDYLIDTGVVKLEPLTYIRGRSLPRRFMIIDESQNLRPVDMKTIITRCGDDTKIVFTGDMEQIDTPYLDKYSNGLAYLISRFLDEEVFCYLDLKRTVRSPLAELAARLL